jgi:hypothetical protein
MDKGKVSIPPDILTPFAKLAAAKLLPKSAL